MQASAFDTAAFDGGFADLAVQSAQAFRVIMQAMARPGEIGEVAGAAPPPPLSIAAGVVALTLLDPETPVFLAPGHDTPQVRGWIAFHTGAPDTGPKQAMFALGAWNALPLADFPLGTAEYPDRSATLIVERDALTPDGPALRGPGIRNVAHLSLPEEAAFVANARHYPLGLDFIFTCGNRLAALPRTTQVTPARPQGAT
jgi:alpha-D-ribose 1-methylphosphonate 5-triphosphate synthase subunit PhnH